jgi:hypothetical protein
VTVAPFAFSVARGLRTVTSRRSTAARFAPGTR